MGYPVKQAQTARPLVFKMYLTSDHLTAATGKTPTVVISKNGAAFASPAGAVTEVANGWYKVAANATDSGTLGPLVLYATAAACDPCDEVYEVVAFDPEATSLGLLLAKTTNLTGLNDIAATAVVSGGAITTSGGAITTATNVTTVNGLAAGVVTAASIAADAITAAKVAADAVAEIQAGLSTLDAAGVRTAVGMATANLDSQLAAIAAYIDTEVAAVKAKTDQLTFTSTGKVDATLQAAADLATAVGQKVAHIVFRRTMANVEAAADGDTLGLSSLHGLIQQAQKASVSGTTLTVNKTDGTTLGTKTLTTSPTADPITGVA